MIRPLGMPPTPRARSSGRAPVGMDWISRCGPASPKNMIAPSPWLRLIWEMADPSAFSLLSKLISLLKGWAQSSTLRRREARIYREANRSPKGRPTVYERLFVESSLHLGERFQGQLKRRLHAQPPILPAITLPVELSHQDQVRAGEADEGEPDRLPRAVGVGPRDAGHRKGVVGAQPAARALGHRHRDLGADRALLREQVL